MLQWDPKTVEKKADSFTKVMILNSTVNMKTEISLRIISKLLLYNNMKYKYEIALNDVFLLHSFLGPNEHHFQCLGSI